MSANGGETGARSGPHGIFQRFVHSEVSGSFVLMACTIAALVWANSPAADSYFALAHHYVGVSWGDASFQMSVQHWVNDALMVVFFFVVGLEIKRELVLGELASPRQAILPVSAALGGMAIPALLYFALNPGGPAARGWGVPMATDIAFALGILALFGTRAPLGLKVFLTALAIVDDLGAVLVIALFYTGKIRFGALIVAGVGLVLLFLAARARVRRAGVYGILVVAIWIAVFASGVHATVAGILVAMMVPVRAPIDPREFLSTAESTVAKLRQERLTRDSMVGDRGQFLAIGDTAIAAIDSLPPGLILEKYFHLTQSFLILPLFALFNAGVPLRGGVLQVLANPVSLGIVIGLVVGKPLGVVGLAWLTVRSGRASLPYGVTWPQIWGAGCLAGVGFTMSLFVSELAFSDPGMVGDAKLGILLASLIAAVVGYFVLRKALPRAP